MDSPSSAQRPSQYPDLDDPPTFPWAGKKKRKHVTFSGAERAVSSDLDETYGGDEGNAQPGESDTEREVVEEDVSQSTPRKRRKTPQLDQGAPSADNEERDVDDDDTFFTLQPNVAEFQKELKQRQETRPSPSGRDGKGVSTWKRGGRRGKRGPRKPVEPPLEIKMMLSQANSAFVSGELDRVEEITYRIIQMNAEVYAAHALLSGVFLERGEVQMAIVASISAAHLRPNDPSLWRSCANLILENSNEDRAKYLNDAIYCYTRIIRINPKDFESRFERATLLRELGHHGRAARELEQILTMVPEDATVLRSLAEVCIDLDDAEKAKRRYREYMMGEADARTGSITFDWSDVNIYIELFGHQREYAEGIRELKSLARWMLGRQDETYWDAVQDDDREWDANDEPRRSEVTDFSSGRFDQGAYGEGLPLELRVKLGLFRLKQDEKYLQEAMMHFSWLEPKDDRPDSKLFDYPDLFRETADALSETKNHHEALEFYEPLQQVEAQLDLLLYFSMARCYRSMSLAEEADQCYQTVIENDPGNVDARVELARMYEEMKMPQRAVEYVNEVLRLRRQDPDHPNPDTIPPGLEQLDSFLPKAPKPRGRSTNKAQSRRSITNEERAHREREEDDALQFHYMKLQNAREGMAGGDDASLKEWMESARLMTREFRTNRALFSLDHTNRYLRSRSDNRYRPTRRKGNDASDPADTVEEQLTESQANATIPKEYRRIGFDKWLDIFLEYALCLAKQGNSKDCYDTISAAYNSNIYYHSREASFLIQICWATCAIYLQDEETVCNVCRWFMKEYQFTTDTYRLFAAANRMLRTKPSLYTSSPSQKFLLRHIKAMDYSLVGDEAGDQNFAERAAYTARDEQGRTVINKEMDAALLMLYGQVLYMGGSYPHALNYFYRVYALDPTHPVVTLHIALAYLHYALKRQSDNRHYLIMQGLSFLFQYHDARMASSVAGQHQEAKYNVARSFHMLGLTHLAVPYYEQVLSLSATKNNNTNPPNSNTSSIESSSEEDFAQDAAFNLQSLYALAGNVTLAREVTEKWLVI